MTTVRRLAIVWGLTVFGLALILYGSENAATYRSQQASAQRDSVADGPEIFSGDGDGKMMLFAIDDEPITVAVDYRGNAHFSVRLLDDRSQRSYWEAEVAGAYSGAYPVKLPAGRAYVMEVRTKGSWSIGMTLVRR